MDELSIQMAGWEEIFVTSKNDRQLLSRYELPQNQLKKINYKF